MPKQVQLRRGTTSQTAVFTGAQGEITVDTDRKTVVVHDGSTAGGVPLAKDGDVCKKANNLSDVTRATARGNLGVLWEDEARGLVSVRRPLGGVYCDATAAYRMNGYGTANVPFGTDGFSLSAVLQLADYTPATSAVIWASSTGTPQVRWVLRASGSFAVVFNTGGGDTTYDLIPDVALVDGESYQVTVSVDRSGLATLRVNGLSDRDYAGGNVAVSVAASGSTDVSGGSSPWGAGYAVDGVIYGLQVFNYALSAAEVLALHKLGGPGLGQQWGAVSPSYSSNFSAGLDGWTADNLGVTRQVTGNVDGIASENDWLKAETLGAGGVLHAYGNTSTMTRGKRYRIKARVHNPAGSPFAYVAVTRTGVGQVAAETVVLALAANTTADLVCELPVYATSGVLLRASDAAGNGPSVAAGNPLYLKNVTIQQVGCVQALELGSGIGTHLQDLSSNRRHGVLTMSSFAHVIAAQAGEFVVQRVFAHSDISSTGGTTKLLDLPPNCGVVEVQLDREVAFDAGITLDVGISGNNGKFVSAQSVAAAGVVHANSASPGSESVANWTSVYVRKSGATTAGQTTVRARCVIRGS